MSQVIADLLAARKTAIERGDKALGREIYHQLQEMGMIPSEIDGWTFGEPEAPPVAPEAAVREAPEKAVKPKPKTVSE